MHDHSPILSFIARLKGPVPRIAFRRMLRSAAFAELCGYYIESRRPDKEVYFSSLARQLESSFERTTPAISSQTRADNGRKPVDTRLSVRPS